MEKSRFRTPILLIIYNCLDTTQRIFAEIAKQRPAQLFVGSDAPRPGNSHDEVQCEQVRAYVREHIDWECEVKYLFFDTNRGPGIAVGSLISWFFEEVEAGIIFEHDCLPHPDFFPYCEALLEKYRKEERIGMISGDNFFPQVNFAGDASYFAVPSAYIWGWATWRRTWKNYDHKRVFSYAESRQILKNTFSHKTLRREWLFRNHLIKAKKIATWDAQLCFAIWENKQICLVPKVNLVSNIGFDKRAVHCKDANNPMANVATKSVLPLCFNSHLQKIEEYDLMMYKRYNKKSLLRYLISLINYHLFH